MTKALEINVSKEDAHETIKDILKETEKIRQEYINALNDFYAPLEGLEEQYKTQIYRLASIAKEDINLAKEIGKLEFMINENSDLIDNFLKGSIVEPPKKAKIREYFPEIFSLGKYASYDFYQTIKISLDEKMSIILKESVDNDIESVDDLNSLFFIKSYKNYSLAQNNHRNLLIINGGDEWTENELRDVLKYKPKEPGVFLIIPSDINSNKKQNDLNIIEKIDNLYSQEENNLKLDGILYRYSGKLNGNITIRENFEINKNKSFEKIIKQFVTNEKIKEFTSNYLIEDLGETFYDNLRILFNLYNQKEIEIPINNKFSLKIIKK